MFSSSKDILLNPFKPQTQEPGVGDLVRFGAGEHIGHDFIYREDLHDGDLIIIDGVPQYKLRRIRVNHAGLNAFIIKPLNGTDVHVVFRGTKQGDASINRDFELDGPGSRSYSRESANILRQINRVLSQLDHEGKSNLTVNVYGHSLGGADAQRCFVDLMEKIDHSSVEEQAQDPEQANYFHNISGLRMMAYSSAGVPQWVANKAEVLAHKLARKAVGLECFWLHAAGDGVQQSGDASILAEVSPDVARVHLIKAYAHDKIEAAELLWHEIRRYLSLHRMHAAHTKLYFGAGASMPRMEYYTNAHPEGRRAIRKKLLNKSTFFQSNYMILLQKVLRPILDYFFPIMGAKRPSEGIELRPVHNGIERPEPVFSSLQNMAKTFPQGELHPEVFDYQDSPEIRSQKTPWWKYALAVTVFFLGLAATISGMGAILGIVLMSVSSLYTVRAVYKDVKEYQRIQAIEKQIKADEAAAAPSQPTSTSTPTGEMHRPTPLAPASVVKSSMFNKDLVEKKSEAPIIPEHSHSVIPACS